MNPIIKEDNVLALIMLIKSQTLVYLHSSVKTKNSEAKYFYTYKIKIFFNEIMPLT